MQRDPFDEGKRWLDQALRDYDDAKYADEGKRHNLACFLSQQAAEKALKGFLYFKGRESVMGHSVGELCKQAATFERSFTTLESDASGLDVYYIPTRYPNGLPGGLPADAFDEADSSRALRRAAGIIDAVKHSFDTAPDSGRHP